MVRTQIQLTEEQVRQLRKLARLEGVSLAEAIRRCVDRALPDPAPRRGALYKRAATLVGHYRGRDVAADVAAKHARYLDPPLD